MAGPTAPGNLPAELSSFVGRRAHVERGVAMLARSRLLTLVGPGGCGKTRLARRVAATVIRTLEQDVWWVELAPHAEPDQVAPAVARALGVPSGTRRTEVLAAHLAERRALVVLDNCEHLVDAVAGLVDELLRAAPDLRVLATSREPLRVEGEVVWRVPPLEVPPEECAPSDVGGYEAACLFAERAAQAWPEFALSATTAVPVARICRALDGMPLALELAAARAGTSSVTRILTELDDRFRVLTGGPRPVAGRLRSLRASLEWSHDLLDDGERALLRRLSVFAGGFTTEAAGSVAGFPPLDTAGADDALTSLVAKSLVQTDSTDRYRLLESVRAYGRERLDDEGETGVVADRHLAWAAGLAEDLEPATVRCSVEALDRLQTELPNIGAALAHAASGTSGHSGHSGLRLVGALGYFWARRGHGFPGTTLGEASVVADPSAPARLLGRAHLALGYARLYGGAFAEAADHTATALAEAERSGDEGLVAHVRTTLGTLMAVVAPDQARPLLESALATAEATGDARCELDAVAVLAFSHLVQHRPDRAAAPQARADALVDAWGRDDAFNQGWTRLAAGMTAQAHGRFPDARDAYSRSVDAADRIGDATLLLYAHAGTVTTALAAGRWPDLEPTARAMNRPDLRLEDLTRVFATALTDVARIATDRPAAARAMIVAGSAVTPLCPFDGPRLWLEGARHALTLGDAETAQEAASGAHDAMRAIGSAFTGPCRVVLARLARGRGEDPASVEALAHDGLADIADAGLRADLPEALALVGSLALDAGRAEEGTRLLAAAEALRIAIGRHDPFAEATAAELDRARTALGDAVDAVRAEGAALEADAAVAYARRARGPRGRPRFGWDALTPTELEVVRLVAAGHANPDIAARLFVTRGTVKTHLVHVFAKLGIPNRTGLAAEATRRGLA